MSGEERRKEIIQAIRNSREAVSGAELAGRFKVSRQVIVQDIALLRAADYPVIATNKGYVYLAEVKCSRVFKVCHTDEEIEEELNSIVDLGGTVRDVFVNHRVYGRIHAVMDVNSRLKVKQFMEGITSGKSSPLKNVTSGYHYHTVEADSEELLDRIGDMLREKNYLVEG